MRKMSFKANWLDAANQTHLWWFFEPPEWAAAFVDLRLSWRILCCKKDTEFF